MNRSIVCLKVPAFPIAVERVLSVKLRDRPLVLAHQGNPRACCLSVSSEAAAFGIRRGMMLNQARRSCRSLTVIHPNPTLYKRAMNAIQEIIGEYSPLVEPYRPGQNFIDMTGSERLFGKTSSVAQLLRKRLKEELRLPVEAGLSINKLVSRVAAFDASPEGLLEVECGSEESFLEPHQVSVLPAVDRDTRTRLIEFNIRLIQQLKGIELELLLRALGPVAFSLSRQARGVDPEPVTPPSIPPQLVLAEELKDNTNEREIIAGVIKRLVIEGSFQLQRSNRSAAELMLNISYCDGKMSRNINRLREHTNSTSIWLRMIEDLATRTVTRRVRVRRIELTFRRLTAILNQLDLWEMTKDEKEPNSAHNSPMYSKHKFDKAFQALEKLQARFGTSAVRLGAAA